MNELSLFSGAGGGLLGTMLLGFTPIGYVEWDDYCQRVIAARIRDGILPDAPIFGDIKTFICEGYAASYQGMVDVITAGFPCQPFSVAGKQKQAGDERNQWPATSDVISIVRPGFVLLENVPGIRRYLPVVIRDLRRLGYDVRRPLQLGADDCGAPHRRKRVWIMADLCVERRQEQTSSRWEARVGLGIGRQNLADATSGEFQKPRRKTEGRNGPGQSREVMAHAESPTPRSGHDLRKRKSNACESGESINMAHAERNTVRPGLCPDESERIRRGRFGDGGCEMADTRCNGRAERRQDDFEYDGAKPDADGEQFPDTKESGLERQVTKGDTCTDGCLVQQAGCDWWTTEPDVGRVANGVASRVDRLKALGNGQVPRVVATAWKILTG